MRAKWTAKYIASSFAGHYLVKFFVLAVRKIACASVTETVIIVEVPFSL